MGIEAVYWVCLAGGLGFLGLSVLLDNLFDFWDLDVGGNDVSVVPAVFAGVGAFGAGGQLGIQAFGLAVFGSLIVGVVCGVLFAVLTVLLFVALSKAQAGKAFELSDLIGVRGQCSLALGPGTTGRVSVLYQGMTRTLTAVSNDPISPGEEVIVADVVGSAVQVIKSDSLQLPRTDPS